MPWVCRRVVVELVEICTLSLSKCPRFGTFEIQSPPPSNFPYYLALFLASPKKNGEKEGRRSDAAGLLFRETPHGHISGSVAYVDPWCSMNRVAGRISAEKPSLRHRSREG